MKLSYSQRLEDIHLEQVLDGVAAGTYIDVGGGHPVADNVTFRFYLAGWRGLVVEPQERLAETHRRVRPRDIVHCGLVGRCEGTATFHAVAGMHGFSTMRAAHASAAEALGAAVRRETRSVRALASLTAEHGLAEVHLLKIDVEGAEGDVLAGADWTRARPWVLVVEAVAPGTMAPAHEVWDPFVVANGYRFAFFDGLNRFYVAEEHARLAGRFPAEPLAWDSVAHLWDGGRAATTPAHPDHALAARLAAGLLAELPHLDAALLRRLLLAGGPELSGADLDRLIAGTAARPGMPAEPDPARRIDAVLASDAGRAALGRIAAAYDGGFVMED
jgi:FkbM family methyltransferase